jgi:NADPH2:quinone reductase
VEGSWKCIARGGRYLAVGFADDPESGMRRRALRPLCSGNFSVVGVISAYMSHVPPAVRRMGFNPFDRAVAENVHADLMRLVASGEIRPVVGRRIRPDEAGAALDDHEHRRTRGRTVVLIAGA